MIPREEIDVSGKGANTPRTPSSSAVASWYCWYSETRSFMLLSASVNSISSIPSPVYQCKKAESYITRTLTTAFFCNATTVGCLSFHELPPPPRGLLIYYHDCRSLISSPLLNLSLDLVFIAAVVARSRLVARSCRRRRPSITPHRCRRLVVLPSLNEAFSPERKR
ncbi:hypothetical protein Bca101_045651 [Brassica carinata]